MPEPLSKPSIREFSHVVWEDWGSRVSGALSVPFTVLAFFVSANYAKAIWAVLAGLAILTTLYQVWSKERRRAVDLEQQLEREREQSRPNFSLQVEQSIIGETQTIDGSVGFLNVTIINNGAPSIAHKWEVTLHCQGVSHTASLHSVAAEIATPSGERFSLTPRDAIYERTINPIPRGGLARGWITAVVGGVKRNVAGLPGATWTISCEDSLGVRYSASHIFVEDKMMDRPQYYPGSFGTSI